MAETHPERVGRGEILARLLKAYAQRAAHGKCDSAKTTAMRGESHGAAGYIGGVENSEREVHEEGSEGSGGERRERSDSTDIECSKRNSDSGGDSGGSSGRYQRHQPMKGPGGGRPVWHLRGYGKVLAPPLAIALLQELRSIDWKGPQG